MKVLITGANGFLGRHVVSALARSGHAVRALIRPAARVESLDWGDEIEIARADFRDAAGLALAVRGTDAVVHLAAAMTGDDFARFSETATTTERLFEAMRACDVRRLVLCSSFSVYDWCNARDCIDEDTDLLRGADVYARGGYATAKLWQERLARRMADELGWELTVIRPGFIWGRGNECPEASIGPSIGPLQLVFCASRQLPYTHVENAADCFREALENSAAVGETFNLVDGYALSAWQFSGESMTRSGKRGIRVPLAYWLVWPAILGIFRVARAILGPNVKLPYTFMPAGFAQGYRPLRFSTRKLSEVLKWRPPLSLTDALEATFPESAGANVRSKTGGAGL